MASTFLYISGTFLFLLLFTGASVPTSGANVLTTTETSHLRVRIEPKLLARLEKSRQKSGNTLTGEIVARLEESFRRDDTKDHLIEMVQLVKQELQPPLSYAGWVHEASSIDKLERLAARADSEHDKNTLLEEAAQRRARLDERTKEEVARMYVQVQRKGSALKAFGPAKKRDK